MGKIADLARLLLSATRADWASVRWISAPPAEQFWLFGTWRGKHSGFPNLFGESTILPQQVGDSSAPTTGTPKEPQFLSDLGRLGESLILL